MDKKKLWTSKTFWVNILSVMVLLAQTQTGFIVSPESQVAILAVVNLVLRAVTGKPIEWKKG